MLGGTAVLVLAATMTAQAVTITLNNAGFETGDLTGWTTSIPSGASVSVVSSHTDYTGWGTGTTSWSPYEGEYFALLKTDGPGNWCQLYQSFTAQKDDVLSFAYFWDSRDYKYYDDTAQGRLVDSTGNNVATLFYQHVNGDPSDYYGTPWTRVDYAIPASETYKVVFEIANGGDSGLDSYLGVDAIPEPVTMAGLMLGIGGLVGYARKRLTA